MMANCTAPRRTSIYGVESALTFKDIWDLNFIVAALTWTPAADMVMGRWQRHGYPLDGSGVILQVYIRCGSG